VDHGGVGAFQRQPVLGRAGLGIDGQVLGRLQEQTQAGDLADLVLQPLP
jgi:hypothetical protein